MAENTRDRTDQSNVRMPRVLDPGWAELVVSGGASATALHIELMVVPVDGTPATYELTVPPDGTLRQVLWLERSIGAAALTTPPARVPGGVCELRPLGRLGLLARALRADRAETLRALRWRLVGKKVRSRNILLRLLGLPRRMAYAAWRERHQAAWDAEAAELALRHGELAQVRIGVIVVCRDGATAVPATLASIAAQRLQPFELRLHLAAPAAGLASPLRRGAGGGRELSCGPDDRRLSTSLAEAVVKSSDPTPPSHPTPGPFSQGGRGSVQRSGQMGETTSLADAVATSAADWLVLLQNGHALAPDSLLRMAAALALRPQPAALTWDSDAIGADDVRHAPELKPQWNEALFLARDYVGAFAVSRRALAAAAALAGDMPDALLLGAVRSGQGTIAHIPRVLSHRLASASESDETQRIEARRALVAAYVRNEHPLASANIAAHGMIRAVFPLPDPRPLVSLIVPTRDRLDLLTPCIDGLLNRTRYAPIEVLIADNGSREAATRTYLESIALDPRVRVIDCAGPFNFAAINNKAVAEARGRVIGFINNDVEPIASDWLAVMVAHALRPRIGAVGAKLLYPSGLVQHAGVVLGIGGYAGHAHRFARPTDRGYLGRLQAEQHFAAVTAACLVVEKAKFDAVGGFDALAFPVAYNDVDLCLRLRAAGFATLWTPYAELLHKESASRARDYSPARRTAYDEECRRLIARWGALIADDPHYHPALSRHLENFSLD